MFTTEDVPALSQRDNISLEFENKLKLLLVKSRFRRFGMAMRI